MRFRKASVVLLILTLLGIAAVSQSGGPGHAGGQPPGGGPFLETALAGGPAQQIRRLADIQRCPGVPFWRDVDVAAPYRVDESTQREQ